MVYKYINGMYFSPEDYLNEGGRYEPSVYK